MRLRRVTTACLVVVVMALSIGGGCSSCGQSNDDTKGRSVVEQDHVSSGNNDMPSGASTGPASEDAALAALLRESDSELLERLTLASPALSREIAILELERVDIPEVHDYLRRFEDESRNKYQSVREQLSARLWAHLRTETPLGRQLADSDAVLRSVAIRYVGLRGRLAPEAVDALMTQTQAQLSFLPTTTTTAFELHLQLAATDRGEPCRQVRVDFEAEPWPRIPPPMDATIPLLLALGPRWRYLDPHTIEVGCRPGRLANVVRRSVVRSGAYEVKVDVRERNNTAIDNRRQGCFSVELEWPARMPSLDGGAAVMLMRQGGVPLTATLEDLEIAHLPKERTWAYRGEICTGPTTEEHSYNRAHGRIGDKEYEVRILPTDVLSAPTWRGDESRVPLEWERAIDLATTAWRRRYDGRVGVVPMGRLKRLGRTDHWSYFIWVGESHDGPLDSLPFGVTMAGSLFEP